MDVALFSHSASKHDTLWMIHLLGCLEKIQVIKVHSYCPATADIDFNYTLWCSWR